MLMTCEVEGFLKRRVIKTALAPNTALNLIDQKATYLTGPRIPYSHICQFLAFMIKNKSKFSEMNTMSNENREISINK